MKMTVFWVVAPCSQVEVYRLFRGDCCIYHKGDRPEDGGSKHRDKLLLHDATTQKTIIFMLAAVRTSILTYYFSKGTCRLHF
jgi:hypothetical protein